VDYGVERSRLQSFDESVQFVGFGYVARQDSDGRRNFGSECLDGLLLAFALVGEDDVCALAR